MRTLFPRESNLVRLLLGEEGGEGMIESRELSIEFRCPCEIATVVVVPN